jgi:hypothetical protein
MYSLRNRNALSTPRKNNCAASLPCRTTASRSGPSQSGLHCHRAMLNTLPPWPTGTPAGIQALASLLYTLANPVDKYWTPAGGGPKSRLPAHCIKWSHTKPLHLNPRTMKATGSRVLPGWTRARHSPRGVLSPCGVRDTTSSTPIQRVPRGLGLTSPKRPPN